MYAIRSYYEKYIPQVAVGLQQILGLSEKERDAVVTNLTYLSLWHTSGREYGFYDDEWKMIGGAGSADSVIIASEP